MSTIGQRESALRTLFSKLNGALAELTAIQTPTYREWRKLCP